MVWSQRWAPYVPVATRHREATELAKKRAKSAGRIPQPVTVSGRVIASTFWGKAWCDHLETWKDYDNRLPRGVTYLRNGSVVDLFITKGKVEAIVAGSEPYFIDIRFTQLPDVRWKKLRSACTASIDSLIDLLAGKFSKGLMELLTSTRTGLFPSAGEMQMTCDCPDSSRCCKHLAAVIYAIGAKLDHQPELLFVLRGVDHQELVAHATSAENLDRELSSRGSSELQTDDLGQLFGIDLAAGTDFTTQIQATPPMTEAAPRRKAGKKKALVRSTATPSGFAASASPGVAAKPAGTRQRAGKKTVTKRAAAGSASARTVSKTENTADALLSSIAQHIAAKAAVASVPSAAPTASVRGRGRKKSSE